VQLAGDGEDNVEVVDWQDAIDATLDPASLVERLVPRDLGLPALPHLLAASPRPSHFGQWRFLHEL
jgi:hypothetical protein